ncbi:MAG: peptide chain release factor N(5)-glutamine methyltransferase [Patescibacteria group bacterium]|jgi:release factor glutamine methyltransferase
MNLKTAFLRAKNELNAIGIKTAELDAKVLLLQVIEENDVYLLKNPLFPLTNSQYSKFRRCIRRRKSGEPVAYILGHKEFFGFDFKVNKNVLIPRPETELIVEQAIEFIKHKVQKFEGKLNIIDIGTGSGCIIISIANSLRTMGYGLRAKLYASDISDKALRVARLNAKKNGVNKQIKFFRSDLFSNGKLPKKFDLILANLPYLKSNYKNLDSEPKIALDGGRNGLKIVSSLIELLPEKLNRSGIALLEIDNDQPEKIKKNVGNIPNLKFEEVKSIPHWHGTIKISRN